MDLSRDDATVVALRDPRPTKPAAYSPEARADRASHRRVLAAVAYLQRQGAPVVAGRVPPPPTRPSGSPT